MENKKAPMGLMGLFVLLIFLAVIIGGLVYLFANYNVQITSKNEVNEIAQSELKEDVEESKEEKEEIDILEETYIAKEFEFDGDKCYKDIMASCENVTATVKKDGKLEIVIGPAQGQEKTTINTVEGIEGEIVELKFGIVKQRYVGGKGAFVRDVFVLTRTGDVYAVNITYGYREDLVNKILDNVIKLENAVMTSKYEVEGIEQTSETDIVVAKKNDGTYVTCDDGERDGE